MPLSLLFALVQTDELPLNRYAQLIKTAPAVEVKFVNSKIQGELKLVRGSRFRYALNGQGLDYLQVQGFGEMVEISRPDQQYDIHSIDALTRIASRISPAHLYFPDWVFVDDLRKLLPEGKKFSAEGTAKVEGKNGLVFHFREGSGAAFDDVRVVLTPEGIPLEIHQSGQSMAGAYNRKWTVQNMRSIPKPSDATFKLPIPDGFAPFSVESVYGMVEVGSVLPVDGWKSTITGRPLDLKKALAQGGLVAILGAESEPSRLALATLTRLKKLGATVVILSDQKSDFAEGFDGGSAISKLSLQGTPTFFKVDAEGKILSTWMGFDSKKAAEFEREVRGN